ncbi:MAG: hypothetical protein K2H85_03470 [Allobaculum sp.]|nr:hypothetical protein [Allobaculum sp.]
MSTDFFKWDDEITSNGNEFVVLMPGTYEGVITKVEKGRSDRPGELYGCPYADVSISISDDGQGNAGFVKDRIYLSRKMEFKIGSLLMALGLKKKDEPIRASKLLQAEGMNVKVVLICQYKNTTDGKYYTLGSEQVSSALEQGTNVYNSVKRYEPSDNPVKKDDSFSFDQFGYQGS